jgi:hypothetical protein
MFVSTNSVPTYAAPAGWTLVGQQVHTASTDLLTRLYLRVATSADASAAVRVTLPGTIKTDISLLAYRGVDPASPIAAWASAQESTVRNAHSTPGLTLAAPARVVSYWAEKTSTTTDWVPPAGQEARTETSGSGSGRLETLAVDSGVPAPSGSWAPLTAGELTPRRRTGRASPTGRHGHQALW